jgi:predicted  nucleic acid-binding Zn-ribbon protein
MNGAAMLALQQLDTAIDQLAVRRTRIPEVEELASATAARDAWEGELHAAQRQQAVAEEAIAACEREGAQLTSRQQRLEAQLKTVIAPREAEALLHEIETIRAEHGELDDRELAALQEQADEVAHIDALRAAEPAVHAQVDTAQAAHDAAAGELDAELARLVAQRAALRHEVDAADLADYDGRRTRFGGVAIAMLNGTRCEGCHLDLSRAEVDELKQLPADVLAECPQCGRFLVR